MGLRQRIEAFLHPTQVKVNPAYQGVIQYGDTPRPITMPKNYQNFAKEGYRGNDTVFKCVSYIARNGAAIQPKLYTSAAMDKEIKDHPLLDLLKKPNNEQSGVAYREAVISYKLISGNAFQYALRPTKTGAPRELWALRPDFVEPIPDKKRGIVGYKYEFQEEPIAPSNIGHSRYWNPDNDHYGLSPLEVAAVHADMQKAAKLWNLSLLQNSARPPGAWTVPTPLSKPDRDRLEQKLKEKLQGYKNAGTPPVLDAGLTWQNMGLPPAELDWLNSLKYNSGAIANVYNMPPQLIGDTSASTYDNMAQAKVASYTEAIFPELDDLYALWNTWLVPMYPDLVAKGAYLYYDKKSVEVIQEVLQAQKKTISDQATAQFMAGEITLNEAREMVGKPTVPGGNVYKFGNVLIPVEKLGEYADRSLTTSAAPQSEPIQGDTNVTTTTNSSPPSKSRTSSYHDNPSTSTHQPTPASEGHGTGNKPQPKKDPIGASNLVSTSGQPVQDREGGQYQALSTAGGGLEYKSFIERTLK